jgi:hypothetical protein
MRHPWWIVKSQNEFKLKDGFECGATITQDIASIEIKEAEIGSLQHNPKPNGNDHWFVTTSYYPCLQYCV